MRLDAKTAERRWLRKLYRSTLCLLRHRLRAVSPQSLSVTVMREQMRPVPSRGGVCAAWHPSSVIIRLGLCGWHGTRRSYRRQCRDAGGGEELLSTKAVWPSNRIYGHVSSMPITRHSHTFLSFPPTLLPNLHPTVRHPGIQHRPSGPQGARQVQGHGPGVLHVQLVQVGRRRAGRQGCRQRPRKGRPVRLNIAQLLTVGFIDITTTWWFEYMLENE